MKRSVILVLVLLIAVMLWSSQGEIELSAVNTGMSLTAASDNGIDLSVNISNITFNDISTPAGTFTGLSVDGFTKTNQHGSPRLPRIRRIFSVPLEAEVEISATAATESIIDLNEYQITSPLFPAQPPLAKSTPADEVEFVYNESAYQQNFFNEQGLARVEDAGIMRGVRIFVVDVTPVRYNPVSNQLLVQNDISISISFEGGNMAATEELRQRTWSPVFEKMYQEKIINYTQSREDLTRYPIKYVIISDPMFEDQLQDFIDWKTTQGYDVITGYTDVIGSSTSQIAGFISDLWDEATPDDPAPSFILFVGDTAQIPAYSGSEGSHVTDLNYVRLEGGDYIPEIYYGRFSAQNTAQLQPQIDKTLMYETYSMSDPSYLGEAVMIAGMDSSHGSTWGNGQINYGTTYYFNEEHDITSHTYLYPQSGNNSANIIQNVSDGVSYINYTAHGSSTSWADPSFTIANINSLQNSEEYCFAVGNCCLTNKFEVSECFGEAWLRAEDKGAIGYIGGTNSTYWDEDYHWGVGAGSIVTNPTYEQTGQGAYDGMWHDHDEEFNMWYTVGFAYIMAGNLAVLEGGGMINYYWEIYSIMGDPSISVYFGVPEENSAVYPEELLLGLESVEITADPYSYVALTYDGEIKGVGLVDETGVINLQYTAFDEPCMATLAITRQNREPIITEIQVIPNDGAYIVLDAYTINADGDEDINAGDNVLINLDVENLGTEDALETSLSVGLIDEYITIEETEFDLGTIPSQSIVEFDELISFDVSEDIPFGHPIRIDLDFTSAGGSWTEELNLISYAPPGLWINPGEIEAEVDSTEIFQSIFSISNWLDDPVNYSIRTESDDRSRDITGSYVDCSYNHFEPGGSYEWDITAYNQSPDGEWISDVTVTFPEGVTVEDAGNMTGGAGGMMEPDITSGNGVSITWHGATQSGYGYLHEFQSATASVNITVDDAYTGYITCEYEMIGDGYGNDPHEITGNFELSYPLSWISLDITEGELAYGQTDFIEVTLNPEGMEAGTHECEIVITDSRIETRIPVTMVITGATSIDEGITSASLLKGNYPNPFNPVTTISYTVGTTSNVTLEIFNMKGQKVKTLVSGVQSQGDYNITWQGNDDNGSAVGSGIYLYRFQAGDTIETQKMMMIK